jgi:hypothetical protein
MFGSLFFWTLGLVVEVSRVPDDPLAAWVDGVAYICVRAASRGWITFSIIGSKVPVGAARVVAASASCGRVLDVAVVDPQEIVAAVTISGISVGVGGVRLGLGVAALVEVQAVVTAPTKHFLIAVGGVGVGYIPLRSSL